MKQFVTDLINNDTETPDLSKLIGHIAQAPFSTHPLEVDPPLWGGFWQFDVIAPGYTLPAVELAFLRATRLDRTWSANTSLAQFLADLRSAISHPQAAIWALTLKHQPCVVIASPYSTSAHQSLCTVIWYCASTANLHAAYRTTIGSLHLPQATILRAPLATQNPISPDPDWIKAVIEERDALNTASLEERLDLEILRLRVG